MIREAFCSEEEETRAGFDVKSMFILAVATSIDALAVGISYACTGYDSIGKLALPLVTIGIVSFLMSVFGFWLGVKTGDRVVKKLRPELVGGIILIGIGVKILLEHLGVI